MVHNYVFVSSSPNTAFRLFLFRFVHMVQFWSKCIVGGRGGDIEHVVFIDESGTIRTFSYNTNNSEKNEPLEICPITPLFMGAESFEKSESVQTYFATFLMYALYGTKRCAKTLETFTFDNNRAIWSRSLQTFCVSNVAEESCTAEIIPVRGPAKNMSCSRGSHNPYTITRASPTRRTPHQTWTWITRLEYRQAVRRGCCGSSSCSSFDHEGPD